MTDNAITGGAFASTALSADPAPGLLRSPHPITAADPGDPTRRVVRIQLLIALGCILCAVFAGALTVVHYIDNLSPAVEQAGFGMQKMRPLHTTFASAWIFAGCLAVIYHYLGHTGGGLTRGDLWRFKFHTLVWLGAGVGIVVSMALGVYSGREYLGFHWACSALLLVGWLAYAFSFLRRLTHGFWHQPVYIYLWTIGTLYFIYTFVEGHAHYFLPSLQQNITHDIAVQWKSCGTLVGSFNFLIYGSLIYISERITGNKEYAQSRIAFALFGIGCLNSFTNFAHHTYHVPQTASVKWIAFVVSMAEAVIFLRLMLDITRMVRQKTAQQGRGYNATAGFFNASKWWSCVMIFWGIVISVPNLNSLVHGTHVVVGHAMGTELGIDSLVLFGAITFLLSYCNREAPAVLQQLHHRGSHLQNILLNLSMAALVAWLTAAGLVKGVTRFYGEDTPSWVVHGTKYLFPTLGTLLALALLHFGVKWMRVAWAVPEGEARIRDVLNQA
jgi:nitric oxide reductase subunit B